MATAADLAGAELPADVDSISFAPTFKGMNDKQKEHAYLYWEFYEQGSRQAVRFGTWKAIREPMITGSIQLYDLSKDIAETNDLAATKPELVEQAAQDDG